VVTRDSEWSAQPQAAPTWGEAASMADPTASHGLAASIEESLVTTKTAFFPIL
jgi:hypothetical protein